MCDKLSFEEQVKVIIPASVPGIPVGIRFGASCGVCHFQALGKVKALKTPTRSPFVLKTIFFPDPLLFGYNPQHPVDY